jgi:hypothetical protein
LIKAFAVVLPAFEGFQGAIKAKHQTRFEIASQNRFVGGALKDLYRKITALRDDARRNREKWRFL